MAIRHEQRGMALVISLVMLLLLTMLGVTAVQVATLEERMAGNTRDRHMAFQAAEAALRGGETLLGQAALPDFAGTQGLYATPLPLTFWSIWDPNDWSDNAVLYDGELGSALSASPRFVVEEIAFIDSEGESAAFGEIPDMSFYRITARGVGGTDTAVVILQSVYRR
jgi:type IV pilus assembly protein PilX